MALPTSPCPAPLPDDRFPTHLLGGCCLTHLLAQASSGGSKLPHEQPKICRRTRMREWPWPRRQSTVPHPSSRCDGELPMAAPTLLSRAAFTTGRRAQAAPWLMAG
jgi:hypothetical protein